MKRFEEMLSLYKRSGSRSRLILTISLFFLLLFFAAAITVPLQRSSFLSAEFSKNKAHAATTDLTSIKTVFVIVMENHNWSSIKGSSSAPYINKTLMAQASRAENYKNLPGLHPSLPNYLWMEAGDNLNVFTDDTPAALPQSTTAHLVTQLQSAGIPWKAYEEDIPGTDCPLNDLNAYSPHHDPFVYFSDVSGISSTSQNCISHIRPFTELSSDLSNNTQAQYNFITPNLCDDMHDDCTGDAIKQGDDWLAQTIPQIMQSQAYKNNGAIFVTWDESEGSNVPIGMMVLSPLAKGNGYSNGLSYTHSSFLRTLQDIFNVRPYLGDAVNATNLSDLFAVGSNVNPTPTPTPTVAPQQPTPTPSGGTTPQPDGITGAWQMIFNDEFNGNSIDTSKWAYGTDADGLGGLAHYSPSACSENNGALHLTGLLGSTTGSPYTSCGIWTQGKEAIPAYGVTEMRAKIPATMGTWPALWSVAYDRLTDQSLYVWEIDTMEAIDHVLSDGVEVSWNLHARSSSGGDNDFAAYHDPNGLGANIYNQWHTFSTNWTPTSLAWYVDGIQQFKVTQGQVINGIAVQIPTMRQVEIIQNAVGGAETVNDSGLPSTMDVDYVRIWQAGSGPVLPTPTATPTPTPSPTPVGKGIVTISTPLKLNATSYQLGNIVTGSVTYKNTGTAAITIQEADIDSRPPGGTNKGGPFTNLVPPQKNVVLQPAQSVTVTASRTLTSTDPVGQWYAYATYQDTSGVFHDDATHTLFSVTAPSILPTVIPTLRPTATPTPLLTNTPTPVIPPVTASNLLRNASFDSTGNGWLKPWHVQLDPSVSGYIGHDASTKADGAFAAKVVMTVADSNNPWNFQLRQDNVPLRNGASYTVSFFARASASNAPLEIVLQQSAAPYNVYWLEDITLSSTWKKYSFKYTQHTTDKAAFFGFNLAGSTSKVWLDKVVLTKN